jgi:hypothetical protein
MTVTTPSKPALNSHSPSATRKSVLITVHEVLLGTAAALGSRRTPKTRRDHRKRRDVYPKHCEYLERALMAREMSRL